MRSGAPRRLARVALGVLAFCAAVLIPARLGEAGAVLHGGAALDGGEPGRPGWVVRVDERLALRMPGLDDGDRRSLARTLVVEAELARIDPLLVLALIEVESSYEVGARSDRGAHGLMQLREPTLRREVERAGLEWDDDAYDPEVNVRAGIRYLRRLLDAFGREEVALMAYNAGPNRILGYLREAPGEIPDRFRAYPRKVAAEVRRLRRGVGRGASARGRLRRPRAGPLARSRGPARCATKGPHAGHRDLLLHPGRGQPRREAVRLRPVHRVRPALRLLRHGVRVRGRHRHDARPRSWRRSRGIRPGSSC